MRIPTFLAFTAIFVGIIGMFVGWFFAIPKGFDLGVFLVGAGFALTGFEALITGRMVFRTSADQYEAYAGAPAVIVGLMAVLVGAALIGCAYLLTYDLWRSTVGYLTRRPGPALIGAGALVAGVGVLLMMNPRGRQGLWWTLLVRVPRWILGLAVVLAALAAIGLGIWELLEPQAYNRFVAGLPRQLDWQAFERWWRN